MTIYSTYQNDHREEVRQTWSEFTVDIVFEPRTGNIKPWEMWVNFPHRTDGKKRVRWGSFKTKENAEKNLAKISKKWNVIG